MPLVKLVTLYDPVAAQLAHGRLVAAGIDAVVFDTSIASLIGSGVSGVRLLVAADQEADARALLDDLA